MRTFINFIKNAFSETYFTTALSIYP